MKQKRLSDIEKQQLVADKKNSMKDADIAKKYGCAVSTVNRLARKAGITRPRTGRATIEELLRDWDKSMPEIRRQCGYDNRGVDTSDT